jgi:micrococcal nuclease
VNLRSRRRKTATALMVTLMLVLLGYLSGLLEEHPQTGPPVTAGFHYVEHVTDGDSMRLSNGARVRLAGLNAPELGSGRLAEEATAFARKMLEDREVRIEPASEPLDKYNRSLAYVYTVEGLFVNVQIIRAGYAYAWPYEPNTEHALELLEAQKEAQAARLGVWEEQPRKSEYYVVETGPRYSLTHRPSCPELRDSKYGQVRFEDRIEAINHNGGAPPCRKCKP